MITASLWLLACRPDPERPGGKSPDDPDPTDTTPPISTTLPTRCAVDAGLALTVETAQGRLENDREITVTTSAPATVAALCTADDDPAEQHLAESTTEGTDHTLRLQGLLPQTPYTCRVAATCPTTGSPPVDVAFTTGDQPEFPVLEVDVDPDLGMTGYWTLIPYMQGACAYNDRWILLYDADGVVRWWYQLPTSIWLDVEALYDPADNTITWGGGDNTPGRARIVDLWAGDVYVTDFPGWDELIYSHDAKKMPDGQLLTLDYRETTDGTKTWLGFGALIHDPATHEVTWDLASQRYFDEGWLRAGNGPYSDPYHGNWMEYVAEPGRESGGTAPPGRDRLYVSLCEDWSLMSFDVGSGDVRWKLERGAGWTVLDADGSELPEDELPQCQHGNQVIGDDELLVYDNGQGRGESRIEHWIVDPVAMTATRAWMWTEPGWHEGTLGDVDVLDNGRMLVTEAHPECWSESPGNRSMVVELDPATGEVASRLTFPQTADTTYRAERYDGCTLMSSLAACPALAARADALAPQVGW